MFPSTTKTVQLRKGMGTSKIGVGKIQMFTLAFEASQFWSPHLTLSHLLCSRDTCSTCSWGRCAPSCLPGLLQDLAPSCTISSLFSMDPRSSFLWKPGLFCLLQRSFCAAPSPHPFPPCVTACDFSPPRHLAALYRTHIQRVPVLWRGCIFSFSFYSCLVLS